MKGVGVSFSVGDERAKGRITMFIWLRVLFEARVAYSSACLNDESFKL